MAPRDVGCHLSAPLMLEPISKSIRLDRMQRFHKCPECFRHVHVLSRATVGMADGFTRAAHDTFFINPC